MACGHLTCRLPHWAHTSPTPCLAYALALECRRLGQGPRGGSEPASPDAVCSGAEHEGHPPPATISSARVGCAGTRAVRDDSQLRQSPDRQHWLVASGWPDKTRWCPCQIGLVQTWPTAACLLPKALWFCSRQAGWTESCCFTTDHGHVWHTHTHRDTPPPPLVGLCTHTYYISIHILRLSIRQGQNSDPGDKVKVGLSQTD